jgi:hypothetical protein
MKNNDDFIAGWNAAIEEAAQIAAADMRYETMEFTAMSGNKKVKHHRIDPGSDVRAEAFRRMVQP